MAKKRPAAPKPELAALSKSGKGMKFRSSIMQMPSLRSMTAKQPPMSRRKVGLPAGLKALPDLGTGGGQKK